MRCKFAISIYLPNQLPSRYSPGLPGVWLWGDRDVFISAGFTLYPLHHFVYHLRTHQQWNRCSTLFLPYPVEKALVALGALPSGQYDYLPGGRGPN